MITSIRGFAAASLIPCCLAFAVPALADETDPPSTLSVTGYIQGVTDYRFRGISLSEGDFAVQGTVNLNHVSGFYAGVWASSLKDTPLYGHAEADLYAGWSGEVASGLTADAGLVYYAYPDGKPGQANYFEPYASLAVALGPATAKLGAAYAWEQYALGGRDNLYLYTDLGASLPGLPVSLSTHLGYSDGALSPNVLTGSGTGGGFDWSAGATYIISDNLSASATYVGVEGVSIDGVSNDTVVGTLKLSF